MMGDNKTSLINNPELLKGSSTPNIGSANNTTRLTVADMLERQSSLEEVTRKTGSAENDRKYSRTRQSTNEHPSVSLPESIVRNILNLSSVKKDLDSSEGVPTNRRNEASTAEAGENKQIAADSPVKQSRFESTQQKTHQQPTSNSDHQAVYDENALDYDVICGAVNSALTSPIENELPLLHDDDNSSATAAAEAALSDETALFKTDILSDESYGTAAAAGDSSQYPFRHWSSMTDSGDSVGEFKKMRTIDFVSFRTNSSLDYNWSEQSSLIPSKDLLRHLTESPEQFEKLKLHHHLNDNNNNNSFFLSLTESPVSDGFFTRRGDGLQQSCSGSRYGCGGAAAALLLSSSSDLSQQQQQHVSSTDGSDSSAVLLGGGSAGGDFNESGGAGGVAAAAAAAVNLADLSAEQIRSIPVNEEGQLTSVGSTLHMTGQCRPCAFVNNPNREGCTNGIACNFCHFPHAKRKKANRPSKRQRMLKKLLEQASINQQQQQLNIVGASGCSAAESAGEGIEGVPSSLVRDLLANQARKAELAAAKMAIMEHQQQILLLQQKQQQLNRLYIDSGLINQANYLNYPSHPLRERKAASPFTTSAAAAAAAAASYNYHTQQQLQNQQQQLQQLFDNQASGVATPYLKLFKDEPPLDIPSAMDTPIIHKVNQQVSAANELPMFDYTTPSAGYLANETGSSSGASGRLKPQQQQQYNSRKLSDDSSQYQQQQDAAAAYDLSYLLHSNQSIFNTSGIRDDAWSNYGVYATNNGASLMFPVAVAGTATPVDPSSSSVLSILAGGGHSANAAAAASLNANYAQRQQQLGAQQNAYPQLLQAGRYNYQPTKFDRRSPKKAQASDARSFVSPDGGSRQQQQGYGGAFNKPVSPVRGAGWAAAALPSSYISQSVEKVLSAVAAAGTVPHPPPPPPPRSNHPTASAAANQSGF